MNHDRKYLGECKKTLNLILKEFLEDFEFSDIAYNYMIGEDGNIYEGRGTYVGAHTRGEDRPTKKFPGMTNSNTIGIAILGKFSGQLNSYSNQ